MHRLKIAVYLLVNVSVAGLVSAIAFSLHPLANGPLAQEWTPKLLPLDLQEIWRWLLVLILFVISVPIALLPAGLGYALWRFTVRPREAAIERDAAMATAHEEEAQNVLDGVLQELAERSDGTPLSPMETQRLTQGIGEPLRGRLLRLLATFRDGDLARASAQTGTLPAVPAEARIGWGARAFAFLLAAVSLLTTTWCGLAALTLSQDAFFAESGPSRGPAGQSELVLVSSSCSGTALVLLLGSLGLFVLIRREERGQRRRQALRDQAHSICLDRWVRRLAGLTRPDSSAEIRLEPSRLARAGTMTALSEVGPASYGELVLRLRQAGVLPLLPLHSLDLHGAHLAGSNLSDLSLTGTNLTGAFLSGARLQRADLSGCTLSGADLRGADATGASLRQASLQNAQLHRCSLRQADLRGADLTGAGLWGADLTEADLRDARITASQLSDSLPAMSRHE